MPQKFYITGVFGIPVCPVKGMVLLHGYRLTEAQAAEKLRLAKELSSLAKTVTNQKDPQLKDLRRRFGNIRGFEEELMVDDRNYSHNQVLDQIPPEAIDAYRMFSKYEIGRALPLI